MVADERADPRLTWSHAADDPCGDWRSICLTCSASSRAAATARSHVAPRSSNSHMLRPVASSTGPSRWSDRSPEDRSGTLLRGYGSRTWAVVRCQHWARMMATGQRSRLVRL